MGDDPTSDGRNRNPFLDALERTLRDSGAADKFRFSDEPSPVRPESWPWKAWRRIVGTVKGEADG